MLQPKISPTGQIDYSGIAVDDSSKYIPYDFEIIDWKSWCYFTHQNPHIPIYAALIYLPLIFGIQRFMKYRQAYVLKRELFLWNAALSIFSIVGFIRFSPDLLDRFLESGGFHKAICISSPLNAPRAFWALAFALSKYVELGDTIWIVLRKKALDTIQWYHHIMTLAVCWLTLGYMEPIGQFFGVMNFGVHSLMYPYFAMKALDIKIPRKIARMITTLQLVQMFIGLFVNVYSSYFYYFESSCYRNPESIKYFFIIYGSFAVLFGKLFYKLVIAPKKKTR